MVKVSFGVLNVNFGRSVSFILKQISHEITLSFIILKFISALKNVVVRSMANAITAIQTILMALICITV
jgi:hypothetical protein